VVADMGGSFCQGAFTLRVPGLNNR
jgi:hypothetical protein